MSESIDLTLELVKGLKTVSLHETDEDVCINELNELSPVNELAGMDDVLEALREVIIWPSRYAKEGQSLGISWPRGLLLHGPPGVGKTSAVLAIAAECNAAVHLLSAASVFGAYTGESERRIRHVFEEAEIDSKKEEEEGKRRPVIIFIDEIDALCPKRSERRQHEARVVAQLLTLLDGSKSRCGGALAVIAATNRPNAIDPALRRPGRFDREVSVPIPNSNARQAILWRLTRTIPLAQGVDIESLAAGCFGYTGADLSSLCREAVMKAIAERTSSSTGSSSSSTNNRAEVTSHHFKQAMGLVGPSIARGTSVEYSPTEWDDIGGLDHVKRKLQQAVEWPLKHGEAFDRLGLSPPRGVLLHGPPGCSKTTLAKAAATASGATFIALSGAQVYSMYLGEGEEILRDAFRRGRLASPSIIFLDEIDSLVGSRGQIASASSSQTSDSVSSRILSTLLTEMDGLELATGVLVMGATNRPAAIDAALMRPGRFDMVVYVPPPDHAGRTAALRVHTKNMPLAFDVDLTAIADKTDYYTGAELAAICQEAALCCLREDMNAAVVSNVHFERALSGCNPLLNGDVLKRYENALQA